LFGRGEIPAFDARVKAAIAAEHVVDHQKDQAGVEDKQAVPRSGLAATRFRLVGTTRLRVNSLYFCTRIEPTEISALRCM
jgi:hypothetical protein